MPGQADIVVVGGGLVGAAIGHGLARGGAKVVLLDEGDIAFRAARGNLGNVWVQGKARTPSSPASTRPFQALAASRAAPASPRATAGTPWSRACSTRRSQLELAASPITASSSDSETTSSACSPTEPVAPRITTFFIRRSVGTTLRAA